jgi:sporulation protein YunB
LFRERRIRPGTWILLIFLSCGGIFYFVEHNLFPTILAIAEAKAVQLAVKTVNDAVRNRILSRTLRYEDLIAIHKDSEGRVVLMQANTVKITEMATDVAVTVEKTLAELEKDEFGIPLGQVLGSQILANYGPRIKVRIIPVGSVKVEILDNFESAGINQTRHRFFLRLDTQVKIVVPLQEKEVRVATDVPLVENVIVGTVPDTFVNVPGSLGLLPQK